MLSKIGRYMQWMSDNLDRPSQCREVFHLSNGCVSGLRTICNTERRSMVVVALDHALGGVAIHNRVHPVMWPGFGGSSSSKLMNEFKCKFSRPIPLFLAISGAC